MITKSSFFAFLAVLGLLFGALLGAVLDQRTATVAVDPAIWLSSQAASTNKPLVAIEFYNPNDEASVAHLTLLRSIVSEHYAQMVDVRSVDITENQEVARVLYGARDGLTVPYTLVVTRHGTVLNGEMPFPDRTLIEASQIIRVLDRSIAGR